VQYQPFTVEYHIKNVSERTIQAIAKLGTEDKKNISLDFLVAGEVKSYINLMPIADMEYTLTYTMTPLRLGILTLPSISLEDRMQEVVKAQTVANKKEETELRRLVEQFSS
jgi:hypothetical protein